MNDCIICELNRLKPQVIFENELYCVHVDKNPATPGHCIVTPKRHMVSLLELDEHEWAALKPALEETVNLVERMNKQELYESWIKQSPDNVSRPYWEHMLRHAGLHKKPDGYNFGNNQGATAGQSIFHVHVHVIPRYNGDAETPHGGVRRVIPGEGIYPDNI